jgi:hypothetical protein
MFCSCPWRSFFLASIVDEAQQQYVKRVRCLTRGDTTTTTTTSSNRSLSLCFLSDHSSICAHSYQIDSLSHDDGGDHTIESDGCFVAVINAAIPRPAHVAPMSQEE